MFATTPHALPSRASSPRAVLAALGWIVLVALGGCGDSKSAAPIEASRRVLHLKPLLGPVADETPGPSQQTIRSWSLPVDEQTDLPPELVIDGPSHRHATRSALVIEPFGSPSQPTLRIVTSFNADEVNLVMVQLRLEGEATLSDSIPFGRLEWRGPDDEFSVERSLSFALPPEAGHRFAACTIPVGDHDLWRGSLAELRLTPFEGDSAVAIAHLVLARASFPVRLAFTGRSKERIQIGGLTRDAVLTPLPGAVQATLDVPDDAELRVAVGGDPSLERGGEIELTVTAVADGRRTILDTCRWTAGPQGRRWQDWRVGLQEWAGRRITLELASEGDGAAPLGSAIWGDPVLIGGREPFRPNYIVISLDTLRADHLGCYGYPLPTSPHLDALARTGILFERVYAQAPYTLPSHASLFTSLYPRQHGFLENVTPPTNTPTLAGILSLAGYRTAGFTEGGFMSEYFGMGLGFDVFDETGDGVESVFERGFDWMKSSGDVPFLLFLHTYEVHSPYDAEDEFRRAIAEDWESLPESVSSERLLALLNAGGEIRPQELREMIALYDAGIVKVDHWVGRLVERLAALELTDDTILVVTSDHGEEFGEHDGFFHGRTLYQDQLHVPLIVSLPRTRERYRSFRARRVPAIVEHVDVLPTLLELAGVERDSLRMEGESLVPLLKGKPQSTSLAIADFGRTTVEGGAIISEAWKYIEVRPEPGDELSRMNGEYLFELSRDAGEQDNLIDAPPPSLDRMRQKLQKLRKEWAQEESLREVDGRPRSQNVLHLEAMRRLGYIGNR